MRNARVTVDEDGAIGRIDIPAAAAAGASAAEGAGAAQGATPLVPRTPNGSTAIVVPGMSNAHSHAFQRGMAGNTEFRLSARDSFWTWRQAMYALANRITPGDLKVLAGQLFVEMLKAGYTAVAEFHYIHRPLGGGMYAGIECLVGSRRGRGRGHRHRLDLPSHALSNQRLRRGTAQTGAIALRADDR